MLQPDGSEWNDDNRIMTRSALSVLPPGAGRAAIEPPWMLRHYFDGELDLDRELSARYPGTPLLSIVHFREVGARSPYPLATLSTQDGAASAAVELNPSTGALHLTVTFASMLSLRFQMDGLSAMDRERWQAMMGSGDDLAFLWGEARWQSDYLICAAHRYYTNVFAFSPYHVEAAFRLTPDVTRRLLDWLAGCGMPTDNSPSPARW